VSSGSDAGGMSALDAAAAQARAQMDNVPATDMKFCAIDDPTCEACQ
jgi:ribonucleoside-diphosphate reductase alpha chain